jgi:hypothetical protein
MKLITTVLEIASYVAIGATCVVGVGLVCRIVSKLWLYGFTTF